MASGYDRAVIMRSCLERVACMPILHGIVVVLYFARVVDGFRPALKALLVLCFSSKKSRCVRCMRCVPRFYLVGDQPSGCVVWVSWDLAR